MIDEVSIAVEKVPELTHLGNPILRIRCAPVSFGEGLTTAQKLIAILDKYRKLTGVGAGLAAPQIGISQNVFVIYDGKSKRYEAFINPTLIQSSKENNYYRESCLSSRMMWGDVKRPVSFTLAWTNIDGKKNEEKFTTFKARLLQHEYDHLLGVPCLDKAIVGTIEYCGDVVKEEIRKKQS